MCANWDGTTAKEAGGFDHPRKWIFAGTMSLIQGRGWDPMLRSISFCWHEGYLFPPAGGKAKCVSRCTWVDKCSKNGSAALCSWPLSVLSLCDMWWSFSSFFHCLAICAVQFLFPIQACISDTDLFTCLSPPLNWHLFSKSGYLCISRHSSVFCKN